MSEVNSSNPHRYEYDAAVDVVYCKLDFAGWPGYRVGDDGSVWTRRVPGQARGLACEWRRRREPPDSQGRPRIALCNSIIEKTFRVHQLILIAFVGPCPDGMQVCHWDDVKTNNKLSNLRYGTQKHNMADRDRNGRSNKGERHGMSKLTDEKVRQARAMLAEGHSQTAVAIVLGVAKRTLADIIRGVTWKHIT